MAEASKFVFWTPRILVIVFALFLGMFSFDVFEEGYTFWGTVFAFFMHNLPSLILLAFLLMSWKHELVGAIIFGLLGVAGLVGTVLMVPMLNRGSMFNPIFPIIGVVSLSIGILFLVGWRQKKKLGKNRA
jgi:peptidoglycan/LPS O-acetylase OafA/YrhL